MPTPITVRAIAAADEAAWRDLWGQYLAFYKADIPAVFADATFARLVDPAASMFGRAAILDNRMIGFAVAVVHEASWTATPVCYLEDLFVDPAARGMGAGRALLQDLVVTCRARGWSRLYWHTSEGNTVARSLYDQFASADDHVRYRMIIV